MALECAHCGARIDAPGDDRAVRCPQCLRSTGLVESAAAAPPPRTRSGRAVVLIGAAVCVTAAVSLMFVARYNLRRGTTVGTSITGIPGIRGEDLPPAYEAGPALRALIARVRLVREPLARARAVNDAVHSALGASGAALATIPSEVPAPRTVDAIWTALQTRGAHVTSLDLARVVVAVLRASGNDADVAERLRGVRDDEPADPSGLLGSYVAVATGHALEPGTGLVVPSADADAQIIKGHPLAGAQLAQGALHAIAAGARSDRVLALAEASVRAWPRGVVPLAVRAYAMRATGGSAGAQSAAQDLAAAAALRDQAPLHLLRARAALTAGDIVLASTEARAAHTRATAWGPSALAAAILARDESATGNDGGSGSDRCAPLGVAREPWTDNALLLCRGDNSDATVRRAAALRVLESGADPMRIAFAAAHGAEDGLARVRPMERDELTAWLSVLGRGDLVERLTGPGDAGR